jgi:iron(II)-dependent oxidoreductase
MVGNVQQWTSTLWGSDLNENSFPYPYQPNDGREEPEADQRLHRLFRLHRGGSYRDEPAKLRCSARGYSDPDSKIRWRGFRVLLER